MLIVHSIKLGHLCPLALILLPYQDSSVIGAGGQNVSKPVENLIPDDLIFVALILEVLDSPGMSPGDLPDWPLMPNQAGCQALGSVFHIKNPHRPIAGGDKYKRA